MDFADVRRLLAAFYADNGLIMARDPAVLQRAFDFLCSDFNHVGLKTNTTKMEAMVFLPVRICTCLTMDTYEAPMGDLYREERHRRKVSCQECGHRMAVRSLWSHLETQHDIFTPFALPADAAPSVAPQRLAANLDIKESKYRCPKPGCSQDRRGGGAGPPSTSAGLVTSTPTMK